MHFAEGSAMLPLLLRLYTSMLGESAAPLKPRVDGEIENHFSFMNEALRGQAFACGAAFTAADVQLSYVLEAGAMMGALTSYPELAAYLERLRGRPAYAAAVAKGGPIALRR
jgi:glutathione S-transferase